MRTGCGNTGGNRRGTGECVGHRTPLVVLVKRGSKRVMCKRPLDLRAIIVPGFDFLAIGKSAGGRDAVFCKGPRRVPDHRRESRPERHPAFRRMVGLAFESSRELAAALPQTN